MNIANDISPAAIDLEELVTVVGGDAWDTYKSQVNTGAADTVTRAKATANNVKQGNFWGAVDNGLGTAYLGLNTFVNAANGWNPIPWR